MQVLIVEDEPVIAERLKRQIGEILGEKLTRCQWFDTLDDARDYLADNVVDLLFLDLNLYGENGFELLKDATAGSFHTIIVSAHADQAIKAFEFGVLDFVAKPFTQARLAKAIERMQNLQLRSDYSARLLSIKKAGAIELLEVESIDYITACGHYTEIFCQGKVHLHDKSIERLQALLPANFERIHRSHIVNMNQVKRLLVEPGSKYGIELKSGTVLPVGRTRYSQIKEKLAG